MTWLSPPPVGSIMISTDGPIVIVPFKILSLQKARVNAGGKKLNIIQVLATKSDR